jgi:hypothetical protein
MLLAKKLLDTSNPCLGNGPEQWIVNGKTAAGMAAMVGIVVADWHIALQGHSLGLMQCDLVPYLQQSCNRG